MIFLRAVTFSLFSVTNFLSFVMMIMKIIVINADTNRYHFSRIYSSIIYLVFILIFIIINVFFLRLIVLLLLKKKKNPGKEWEAFFPSFNADVDKNSKTLIGTKDIFLWHWCEIIFLLCDFSHSFLLSSPFSLYEHIKKIWLSSPLYIIVLLYIVIIICIMSLSLVIVKFLLSINSHIWIK